MIFSIRRWCVLIILFTALSAVGAFATTTQQTRVYEAKATLFVTAGTGESSATAYDGSTASTERVRSYVYLVKSDQVLSRAIADAQLSMTIPAARDALSASVRPGTVLIDLVVRDTARSGSAQLANAVAEATSHYLPILERPASGGLPLATATVVNRANVPREAVFPQAPLQVALASLAALILACAAAVFYDRIAARLSTVGKLREASGVPVLAQIPFAGRKGAVIDFTTDSDFTAEAFRAVRTALSYIAVDQPPRGIVVSSPSRRDGTTFVAVNLARAVAAGGEHSVLIVDAALDAPSVHEALGLVKGSGFSDALRTGEIATYVRPTSTPKLFAITAGTPVVNGSALMASNHARAFFSDLAERFDLVLVDTQATGSSAYAHTLAVYMDGAIMVTSATNTTRRLLSAAIADMESTGCPTLGLVLNGSSAKRS